ncbi:MAG TPA: hypothetical protein VEQ60_11770 [Longimicrobium sp.]|nr:hypothetical protein [Longimicrobium sp.]
MSRPRIRAARWTAAAAAVLALLGGCDNTLQTQTEIPILPPGVHAVVVVTPAAPGSPAEVQLHLRREGVQTPIASYQGELRYDVSRLTVQGGSFPAGVVGAWNEVEPGRIRFAAASLEGLAGTLALTLRATPRGEIGESAFQVRMDELVGTTAFENLTPRFVHREHPLFSTSPLQD